VSGIELIVLLVLLALAYVVYVLRGIRPYSEDESLSYAESPFVKSRCDFYGCTVEEYEAFDTGCFYGGG
jgi:hypothetical protein